MKESFILTNQNQLILIAISSWLEVKEWNDEFILKAFKVTSTLLELNVYLLSG